MPTLAPKPCCQCGVLVSDGTTRCEAHKARPGSFADRSRGTRQQRGYGAEWDRLRELVMQRDAGLCQPCRRHGILHLAHAVDHVVPKARGGTDEESNLQAICRPAHQAKTDAEKRGQAWDEAAWVASRAGQGGGVQMSAAQGHRTDLPAEFSRAGVSGGGVPQTVEWGAL
jgi:5-methylcytosine-specific restriction protein A